MWNWKLLTAAVLVGVTCVAGWLLYATGRDAGRGQVQTLWDSQMLATAQAMTQQMNLARSREQALQAQTDQIQQERRHEVAKLARSHAAALERLRQRPERPAGGDGVPEAARAGGNERSCTGRELFREDGNFLIGEAARADELRLQLVACQAAYRAALTN
jgi:hypothetical protein